MRSSRLSVDTDGGWDAMTRNGTQLRAAYVPHDRKAIVAMF